MPLSWIFCCNKIAFLRGGERPEADGGGEGLDPHGGCSVVVTWAGQHQSFRRWPKLVLISPKWDAQHLCRQLLSFGHNYHRAGLGSVETGSLLRFKARGVASKVLPQEMRKFSRPRQATNFGRFARQFPPISSLPSPLDWFRLPRPGWFGSRSPVYSLFDPRRRRESNPPEAGAIRYSPSRCLQTGT